MTQAKNQTCRKIIQEISRLIYVLFIIAIALIPYVFEVVFYIMYITRDLGEYQESDENGTAGKWFLVTTILGLMILHLITFIFYIQHTERRIIIKVKIFLYYLGTFIRVMLFICFINLNIQSVLSIWLSQMIIYTIAILILVKTNYENAEKMFDKYILRKKSKQNETTYFKEQEIV